MFKKCCVCVSKNVVIEEDRSQNNSPLTVNCDDIAAAKSCANSPTANGLVCKSSQNNCEIVPQAPDAAEPNEPVENGDHSPQNPVNMEATVEDIPTSENPVAEDKEESASAVSEGHVKFKCDEVNDKDEEDEDDDEESDEDPDNLIDKLTATADEYLEESNKDVFDEIVSGVDEKCKPPLLRRKSSSGGILKRPSFSDRYEDLNHKMSSVKLDDDVFRKDEGYIEAERFIARKRSLPAGCLGTAVGRDELALKRHRIFSELVGAARAAVEHKVHFDPLEMAQPVSEKASTKTPGVSTDLEKLIVRLETVVSQLEQVATNFLPPAPLVSPQLVLGLENFVDSPTQEIISNPTMSLAVYEDIINGPLERYVQTSASMQHVKEQAALVKQLFLVQLEYLKIAAVSSPPTNQNDTIEQLKGHTEGIDKVQKIRENNKASPNFTHLSAISESISAIGWICVKPTPAPYIKEMNDVGKYYTNRILKESKGNQLQTDWCVAWTETLTCLEAFVKQYHTTGLVWGGAKGGCVPPPPPPCPPPCMLPPLDADFDASGDDRSALFAQINQGEDITKSLKKVTSDMQTHKNPGLREGPAPFKAPIGAPKPFAKSLPMPGAGQTPAKPPVFARDGKKWLIEYQVGNPGLIVENAEMNNVVYMFRCRDSAVTVKGKINSVVLDSCTKCAVVFDSLVSSIEFVNCQSVQMQVFGKVPTISVDKTDGCQMYLSPDSLDVEIVSSKSSEMNVLIPKGNGDYTELPVAEQFKTTINKSDKSLTTVAIESKG